MLGRLLIALSLALVTVSSHSRALGACGPGKVPAYSDIEAVWYARTGCFGHCPSYQVGFLKNGNCYYVGFKDLSRKGRYEQTCSFDIFKRVRMALQSHDFYHLNYDSSVLVLDAPHYIVAAERCGVTTKLDWPAYENRRDIKSLLDGLDAVTKGISWHKISDSTEPINQWLDMP